MGSVFSASTPDSVEALLLLSGGRSSVRSRDGSEAVICCWVVNARGSQTLVVFQKSQTSCMLVKSYCQGVGFIFNLKRFVPIVIPTINGITLSNAKLLMLELVRNGSRPLVLFG